MLLIHHIVLKVDQNLQVALDCDVFVLFSDELKAMDKDSDSAAISSDTILLLGIFVSGDSRMIFIYLISLDLIKLVLFV